MKEYDEISMFKFKQYLGTYQMGVGGQKKEAVHISRKSGFNMLNLLLPWLFTLEKSRHYALAPSDPEEFFDQLCVAYEKWKRLNAKKH